MIGEARPEEVLSRLLDPRDHDHPSGTGWIRTYTGRWVNLLDPQPDQIDIADIAHGLAMTCRYGGQCATFYSVAEHSMAVESMLRRIGAPRRVLLAGLLHDAAEAYLGDVVRPLKQALPDYRVIEGQMTATIEARFGLVDATKRDVAAAVKAADETLLAFEMGAIRDAADRFTTPIRHIERLFLTRFNELHRPEVTS